MLIVGRTYERKLIHDPRLEIDDDHRKLNDLVDIAVKLDKFVARVASAAVIRQVPEWQRWWNDAARPMPTAATFSATVSKSFDRWLSPRHAFFAADRRDMTVADCGMLDAEP